MKKTPLREFPNHECLGCVDYSYAKSNTFKCRNGYNEIEYIKCNKKNNTSHGKY